VHICELKTERINVQAQFHTRSNRNKTQKINTINKETMNTLNTTNYE